MHKKMFIVLLTFITTMIDGESIVYCSLVGSITLFNVEKIADSLIYVSMTISKIFYIVTVPQKAKILDGSTCSQGVVIPGSTPDVGLVARWQGQCSTIQ